MTAKRLKLPSAFEEFDKLHVEFKKLQTKKKKYREQRDLLNKRLWELWKKQDEILKKLKKMENFGK